MKTYQALWRLIKSDPTLIHEVEAGTIRAVTREVEFEKWAALADEARPFFQELLAKSTTPHVDFGSRDPIPFDSVGNRADGKDMSAAITSALAETPAMEIDEIVYAKRAESIKKKATTNRKKKTK
jgi:hypothetical protein